MQRATNQQQFHEDGTPRRKYETEETQEARYVFLGSLGLAVASAFSLVKNVMFGASSAAISQERSDDAERIGGGGPDMPADFHTAADSGASTAYDEDARPAGPDDVDGIVTWSGFRTALANGYFGGVSDGSTPASAIPASLAGAAELNDNEPLYGPMSSTWMAAAGGRPNAQSSPNSFTPTIASGDTIPLSIAYPSRFDAKPAQNGLVSRPALGGGGTDAGAGGSAGPGATPATGQPAGSTSSPNTGPGSSPGSSTDSTDSNQPRPSNRSPFLTGPLFLGSLLMNSSIVLSISDFLRNAFDPDGDSLHVANLVASSGEITPGHDGSWHFVPTAGDTSEVTFTYAVSDGVAAVQQTAVIDLVPLVATEPPPEENALTVGTPDDDVMLMSGTDDLVLGREGDDVIHGGAGNDRLLGGDGDDLIHGGAGDDVIFAGAGDDTAFGGDGDDVVFGEDGADVLAGDLGNDTVSGGAGDDVIYGAEGADVLQGDGGDDVLDGGSGADRLLGGAGDDIHYGGAGEDVIHAGAGDDVAFGDEGHDVLLGEDGADHLSGGSGDDTMSGGLGDDHLIGDAGSDSLSGGDGDDILLGADGTDTIDGGAGADVIVAGTGDDVADGGAGADIFIALTGDGNDTFDGGEGIDTYDASTATKALTIDLSSGIVVGEEVGADAIVRIENAIGGYGDDTLVASESVNVFTGGKGDDVFVFHSSLDAGNGRGNRDKILDFDVGDRLDLDDIVAEINGLSQSGSKSGDGELARMELISHAAEFTQPGQLRLRYDEFEGMPRTTVLDGNTDFDAATEFQIEFTGDLEELEMILAMHYYSTLREQSDTG